MKAFEKITVLAMICISFLLHHVKAACGPGTYGTKGDCRICPPNYYCPGKTTQPFQCPPGFTSYDGEAECMEISEEELKYRLNRRLFTCSAMAGYYCVGAVSTECTDGKYCPGGNQISNCPRGYKCPIVNTYEICPNGYYSNSGDSYCNICSAGQYCSSASDPVNCNNGQYALEGSTSCTNCPIGSKCPNKNEAPIQWDAGDYQASATQTTCNVCAAGRYCTSPNNNGAQCAVGYYSEAGWTGCQPCPASYSCNSGVKGSQCSNGFYSAEGTDGCSQCSAGYYCPNKDAEYKCMEGYYSAAGATSCTECPVGNYCTGGFQFECVHLTYADQTGMSECRKVPRHYKADSKVAATTVTECGINQYTDGMQLNCYTCDDAHQCSKTDEVEPCPYGFAKLDNQWYCRPCPPGSICEIQPTGTTATTVAAYEASLPTTDKNYPRFSGVAELAPKVCPPNNYCSDDGLIYHICPHGTFPYITGCISCPNNKFCMTSFNRQVTVSTGSKSTIDDSFPRFQPQGYTWVDDTIGWKTTNNFRATKTAKGRVGDASTILEFDCPQGYSCTHSMYARCPSTHQGKEVAAELMGMISEDQNIMHNYETLSGLTYTEVPASKVDGTHTQCLPCNGGYSCSLGNNPVSCGAGSYSPTGEYECFTCLPGHYCPAKSSSPTLWPVNTYNSNSGQGVSASCLACTTGYFAAKGSDVCEPCPGGYECSTGTPILCPIGRYSSEGQSGCSACQEGYMCDKGSAIMTPTENLCPKGSYCSTVSGSTLQYKCPQGTYGISEGAIASSDCIACPPGFVCREGTDDFTKYPCPQGNFCPASTSIPTKCPAGTYNPSVGGMSSASCVTWPSGYYCLEESKATIICPVGYFCPSGTSTADQYPCPAGTYSGVRTGSKIQSECFPCTIGHYCPQGATSPTPAPEGYYVPYMGATDLKAALKCPPGYPCAGTGNHDYKGFTCSKGHYCPPGSISSTDSKCPAGTYTEREDLWSADQCTVCPSGKYCLEGSAFADLVICPVGHYCPPGTKSSTQYPCPTGTFGLSPGLIAETACSNCTAGGSCGSGSSSSTTCSAGFYCPAGTTTSTPVNHKAPAGSYIANTGATSQYENTACGLGNFCPEGSTAPTDCPAGTYSDQIRAASCTACPAGYYWDVAELSAPKEWLAGYYSTSSSLSCTRCPEGYYCHQKATAQATMITQTCPAGTICSMDVSGTKYGLAASPNLIDHPCPVGKYCVGGYATADCPAGTYNPIKGRKSLADCIETPAGFYTAAVASEYETTKCAAGYYCLAGSTTATEFKCPKGTFRGITGGRKPEDCAMCKSGYMCPNEATVTPINCGAGQYCPLGTITPELCPVGTYSDAVNNPDSRSCTKCPSGFYCGSKGMIGTSLTGQECDAGFYCIEGATRPDPTDGITGKICPAGGFCLKGTTSVSACPNGEYNPEEGAKSADSCIPCLPGYYCSGSANPEPTGKWDPGHYCPAGSLSATQNVAPAGHYAGVGADFAIPCPRGTYQPSDTSSACINCEAGAFCPDVQMIAAGTCEKGFYCPSNSVYTSGTLYYEPYRCPMGTYNAFSGKSSLSDCIACPAGKYCGAEALEAVSGDCAAGFYCATLSPFEKPAFDDASNNYGKCPAGYHCVASTSVPTACAAGKYSAMTKLEDNTNCKPCEPGHYCATAGLSSPTGECTPGYFCAEGSTSATAADCTATNYCPQGSANQETCPIGFYNTLTRQGSCTECEAGSTCFNGQKANCPKGYYCP